MERQHMKKTPKDKDSLRAKKETTTVDKTESLKLVEVVTFLQDNLVKTKRLMWCQVVFTGALAIVFFITYFLLLSKSPSTSNVAAPDQKFTGKLLSTSENTIASNVSQAQQPIRSINIPEWEEVQGLLDQVRKAQLEKDINLFLGAYSPSFLNLSEKKENLLKSWQKYNYLDMDFNIENIQKKNAHTIIAKVVWDITLEEVHSKKRVNLVKDYIINFSDVSGKRQIQEVTEGKKSTRGSRSALNQRLL
jgi:hypothetical protein